MEVKNDCGPEWQMEQQIKHYEALAKDARGEAANKLRRASEADMMAERYRQALALLRQK